MRSQFSAILHPFYGT